MNNRLDQEVDNCKHAEGPLQISEEKYRVIVENASLGIYQVTPEGHYITVNKAFARIFGYGSRDELVYSTMNSVQALYAHPEDREWYLEQIKKQGHCTFEVQSRRKDGTWGWVLNRMRSVKDDHGNVMYSEGFVEDISEKKWALQVLQEREERFSIAFCANPAPVVITTVEEGRFIDINDQWLRIMGYVREEMIGRTAYELTIWTNHHAREKMIQKLTRQGFLHEELVWLRTKGGKIKDILWSAKIIRHNDHDVILSLAYDFTERKQTVEEREKLIIELEKALAEVKKLSGLLPICAHCKKIRNDEGYWEQIEIFIKERSDADFSHSVCPACVNKLYPELCEDRHVSHRYDSKHEVMS